MLLQQNAYEINNARLQSMQQQFIKVRKAHELQKSKRQVKSSKRLIALYLYILSATRLP